MILTEQQAYANRWRSISAEAKAAFAALAFVAAFVATPFVAVALALVMAALTVAGARVRADAYAKAASVPWSFVALSAVTLAVSVRVGGGGFPVQLAIDSAQVSKAVAVVARSIAALSAMLFLAMTTPMTDLIALARRMRVPATLVEIMVVSYRSMSVLSDALADMRRAQSARLCYSSFAGTLRSMGAAVALLAVETWRRSIVMHQASLARGGGAELRFLEPERGSVVRELAVACGSGAVLVALAAVLGRMVAL
jgi:cobalt/nickel transport system permease protein